jgi:hypothetical protein
MAVGSLEGTGLNEPHIAALLQHDRPVGELLRRGRWALEFAIARNIDSTTNIARIALVQAKCRNARVRRNLAHLGRDKFSVGIVNAEEAKVFACIAKHLLELDKRKLIGIGGEFKDFGNKLLGLRLGDQTDNYDTVPITSYNLICPVIRIKKYQTSAANRSPPPICNGLPRFFAIGKNERLAPIFESGYGDYESSCAGNDSGTHFWTKVDLIRSNHSIDRRRRLLRPRRERPCRRREGRITRGVSP